MTKRQLNIFFSHFNLSRDYSEESIQELNKVILLELKSSKDDLLHVGDRAWSRNDVLEFFRGSLDSGFDPDEFYKKYEWTKLLAQPEKISYYKSLSEFSVVEEDFFLFRTKEAIVYEERFFNQIKRYFREKNDLSVASMLFYLVGFRNEFQFEVKDTLREMMYTRLHQAEADIHTSTSYRKLDYINFMFANAYYAVLARIGDNDAELINLNLDVFVAGISRCPVDTARELAQKQGKLPLSPEGIQCISDIQNEIDEVIKKAAYKTKVRRIAFFILFGLVVVAIGVKENFNKKKNMHYFDYPAITDHKLSTEDSVMIIMFPRRVLYKGDSVSFVRNTDTVTVHEKHVPKNIKSKIKWR